jgi:hypothetical protein
MDAKQIFYEIISTTPFVCGLPQDDTHSWVTGRACPTDELYIDFLFDGEVNSVHVALMAELVNRLTGDKPFKGSVIKVKCELDGDAGGGAGCIKVHNLHPGAAVRLASWLSSMFGYDCHYNGGNAPFADTFYAFVNKEWEAWQAECDALNAALFGSEDDEDPNAHLSLNERIYYGV